MKFNQLAIGSLFRALSDDTIGVVTVKNNSLYLKVGHNVSVDLHSNPPKDCVFDLDMSVRPVQTKARINYAEYESYQVCAKGSH